MRVQLRVPSLRRCDSQLFVGFLRFGLVPQMAPNAPSIYVESVYHATTPSGAGVLSTNTASVFSNRSQKLNERVPAFLAGLLLDLVEDLVRRLRPRPIAMGDIGLDLDDLRQLNKRVEVLHWIGGQDVRPCSRVQLAPSSPEPLPPPSPDCDLQLAKLGTNGSDTHLGVAEPR